jgi:hypothetical protein
MQRTRSVRAQEWRRDEVADMAHMVPHLRCAVANSLVLIIVSLLATIGYLSLSPRGLKHFAAAFLQLISCVIASMAGASVVFAFNPKLLAMLERCDRLFILRERAAGRAMSAVERAFKATETTLYDCTPGDMLDACNPQERLYNRSYTICFLCTLVAWMGQADTCVTISADESEQIICIPTGLGLHTAAHALATVLYPLQLYLLYRYEKERFSRRAAPTDGARPPGHAQVAAQLAVQAV